MIFTAVSKNHVDIPQVAENHDTAYDQKHGKSHSDREYVITLRPSKCSRLHASTNFGFKFQLARWLSASDAYS